MTILSLVERLSTVSITVQTETFTIQYTVIYKELQACTKLNFVHLYTLLVLNQNSTPTSLTMDEI